MSDVTREIMEEEPGGPNYGRKARVIHADVVQSPNESTSRPLGGPEYFNAEEGFFIERGTAHRGVLHPDEYVDRAVLQREAEAILGFTYADVTAVYKQGPKTAEQREQREKIDARLLALSRAGTNLVQLAKLLDLNEKTLDRALKRARERDVQPQVKNAAVITGRTCFVCNAPAKPRRRWFSTSPQEWVGTIDLCNEHYEAGGERRPGNPRYWEHRLGKTPFKGSYTAPAKLVQTFPANWPSDESYAEFIA